MTSNFRVAKWKILQSRFFYDNLGFKTSKGIQSTTYDIIKTFLCNGGTEYQIVNFTRTRTQIPNLRIKCIRRSSILWTVTNCFVHMYAGQFVIHLLLGGILVCIEQCTGIRIQVSLGSCHFRIPVHHLLHSQVMVLQSSGLLMDTKSYDHG